MSRPSSRLNFWSVPPSSTSASHRHRVVALQQRVEQLEHRDRLAGRQPFGEVVALEQLRGGRRAQQREQLDHRHVQPLAVAPHLQALGVRVEDPQRLLLEGRRVGLDLLRGEHRAQARAPRGVADARGVVADDQHHPVPGVLELAQLAQHDRVAEVDVGRGRVDPELDAQRPALGARACAASPRAPPRAGCRRRSRPARRRAAQRPRRPRWWRSAWGPMLDSRRSGGSHRAAPGAARAAGIGSSRPLGGLRRVSRR